MKTIIIMRHAKSGWESIVQNDFDRTLNNRGENDVALMANKFLQFQIKIDSIICSSAVRTTETAKLFAEEISISKERIFFEKNLYLASDTTIQNEIYFFNDSLETILILGHNTGITNWANQQCGIFTNNMPTCSFAIFSAKTAKWINWKTVEKKLIAYEYPKHNHNKT